MFDGQEIKSAAPDQVEDDVIIHDKFPYIVSLAQHGFKTLQQRLSFLRPNGMGKEGTARLREAAESRDDIVEEAVEEAPEGQPAVGFQEQADRVQIRDKIFGKERPEPSGHTGP